jgi:hypothetical protein
MVNGGGLSCLVPSEQRGKATFLKWLSDAGKATFLFMYKFAYITPQFWEKNKVFQQGTHVVVYQNKFFNLFTL